MITIGSAAMIGALLGLIVTAARRKRMREGGDCPKVGKLSGNSTPRTYTKFFEDVTDDDSTLNICQRPVEASTLPAKIAALSMFDKNSTNSLWKGNNYEDIVPSDEEENCLICNSIKLYYCIWK